MNKFEESLIKYQEALTIYRLNQPDSDSSIADILNNLANIHQGQGQFEKALSLYQEALVIKKRSLPDDHFSIAQSLHNIGVFEIFSLLNVFS